MGARSRPPDEPVPGGPRPCTAAEIEALGKAPLGKFGPGAALAPKKLAVVAEMYAVCGGDLAGDVAGARLTLGMPPDLALSDMTLDEAQAALELVTERAAMREEREPEPAWLS